MNFMSRNTVLLGLKTDFDLGDDSSDFFSSMSEDATDLVLTTRVGPLSSTFNPPKELEQDVGHVTSFNDILSDLTSISNLLENYNSTPPQNDVYLIPENIVPTELSNALSEFVTDQDNQAAYGTITDYITHPDIPDILIAQLELIKFYKEKCNPNLSVYATKDLDSRILSLVHYALIDDDDKPSAIYQLVSSIENYLKNPNPAPISRFFPEYSLEDLVFSLCKDIVIQFPRHPFLQSAIAKFSNFNPKVEDVLSLMPDDSGSDDGDFSDDFFADLGTVQQRAPVLCLELAKESAGDALEDVTAAQHFEPVALPEPPQTVTYLFEDGARQMSPVQFEKWILSIRCEMPSDPNCTRISATSTESEIIYTKQPIVPNEPLDSDAAHGEAESVERYFALFQSLTETRLSVQQLPKHVSREFYSLLLPILHTMNSQKSSGVPCKMFPEMITTEREAHYALSNNDKEQVQKSLNTIIERIKESSILETPVGDVKVEYLQSKRQQPELVSDVGDNFQWLMYVCDYEFIINGRSPLIYSVLTVPITTHPTDSLVCSESWRAKYLFSEHIKRDYSPYVSFRIAFALAINFSERNPKLSCSFIFEALYTLLQGLPMLKRALFVHNALLFFGEMLDKTNKYYYCADVMDNYFLTDIRQLSFSSQIAQIAFRNNDNIRSLFYYTQSLKYFYAKLSIEESIYFGQIVSSIYIEQGYYSEAASVLVHLLNKSNVSQVSTRRRQTLITTGSSLKPLKSSNMLNHYTKKKPSQKGFELDSNSVPTIVTRVTLAIMFCKLNLFIQSEKLLSSTSEGTDKVQMKRLISYFQAWVCLKRNNFQEMFNYIPQFQFPKTRVSLTTNFSILSASKFDPSVASLRLLAQGYLERKQFRKALFWSEIYIHRCYFASLKELGNAFLLRGISLLSALQHCYSEIEIIENDNPSVGSVLENRKYTCAEIANMAYSSLAIAKACFQRVESTSKLTHTNLRMLDLLLEHRELRAEPFQPLTEVPNKNISEWPINLDVQKEDTGRLNAEIESTASLIFNPLYIIYSQLLSSIVNSQKSKTEEAKKLFDYSYNNFFKFFACGCHLICGDFPLKILRFMFHILQRMASVLITFEPEFINDRLLVFDIMNDVRMHIKSRMQNSKIDSINLVKPSFNFTKNVLNLQSPRFPSFTDILEGYNFIDEYLETRTPNIPEYLSLISTNVRLSKQGKITQEEMHNRNRTICGSIEKQVEKERLRNQSRIPSCTSFRFLLQAHPMLHGLVYVQRVFKSIVVYVPSTGALRKVPLINTASPPKPFVFTHQKTPISLTTQSSLFTSNLLRYIAKLISFDPKERLKPQPKYQSELASASQALFGDDFSDFAIDVFPDNYSFGGTHLFGKSRRGALLTLDAGERPVIVAASADLQILPFDAMLPNALTICCPFFSYMILKTPPAPHECIPRVVSCQCTDDPAPRVVEALHALFCDVCAHPAAVVPEVGKCRRSLCFQCPLAACFEQGELPRKFPFCDFVDVLPNSFPKMLNMAPALFVFTYADWCEMLALVQRLLAEHPASYFMFVPALVMKEAFREMKYIFERHTQRFEFAKGKNGANSERHIELKKNTFKFVTTLKLTLQKKLKVPIPLIAHLF